MSLQSYRSVLPLSQRQTVGAVCQALSRAAHESFNLILTRVPQGGHVPYSQYADTGVEA